MADVAIKCLADIPPVYSLMIIGGAMIVLMLIAMVLLRRLRRRTLEKANASSETAGFAMADLEAMRAGGMITDAEFRKLRNATLGRSGLLADRSPAKTDDSGLSSKRKDDDELQQDSLGKAEPQ